MRIEATYLAGTGIMLVSLSFFGPGSVAPAGAQALERPVMSAEQCHPLTSGNYELCCIARNRSSILTPGEIDQCPGILSSHAFPPAISHPMRQRAAGSRL